MTLGISLAAFFLLTPGNPTAQSSTPACSIAGTIVDAATGSPIPRAQLTLQIKSDEATAIADSRGKFLFDHLEPGKYQLYARAPGYSPQGLNQHGSFFTGVVVGNGLDSESRSQTSGAGAVVPEVHHILIVEKVRLCGRTGSGNRIFLSVSVKGAAGARFAFDPAPTAGELSAPA